MNETISNAPRINDQKSRNLRRPSSCLSAIPEISLSRIPAQCHDTSFLSQMPHINIMEKIVNRVSLFTFVIKLRCHVWLGWSPRVLRQNPPPGPFTCTACAACVLRVLRHMCPRNLHSLLFPFHRQPFHSFPLSFFSSVSFLFSLLLLFFFQDFSGIKGCESESLPSLSIFKAMLAFLLFLNCSIQFARACSLFRVHIFSLARSLSLALSHFRAFSCFKAGINDITPIDKLEAGMKDITPIEELLFQSF